MICVCCRAELPPKDIYISNTRCATCKCFIDHLIQKISSGCGGFKDLLLTHNNYGDISFHVVGRVCGLKDPYIGEILTTMGMPRQGINHAVYIYDIYMYKVTILSSCWALYEKDDNGNHLVNKIYIKYDVKRSDLSLVNLCLSAVVNQIKSGYEHDYRRLPSDIKDRLGCKKIIL
ncbi:hypothetical protein D5b_00210 [Faustovirus]|nr:hypothetical protein D5b_00210 [Faustovirus]AMN84704.1 hypothetical protein D6_00301 [Faustovirus]AMP44164.1 hypothetical protein PRJ_Dakar_00208 [Faustovirus]